MKSLSHLPKLAVIAAMIAAVVVAFNKFQQKNDTGAQVSVKQPSQFSTQAKIGMGLYEKNCQVCHGKNAAGTNQGPNFINNIYRKNHHADGSFVLAVTRGVRAHHWPFGDMPPQPQINQAQALQIARYVRELQRANGID